MKTKLEDIIFTDNYSRKDSVAGFIYHPEWSVPKLKHPILNNKTRVNMIIRHYNSGIKT